MVSSHFDGVIPCSVVFAEKKRRIKREAYVMLAICGKELKAHITVRTGIASDYVL